MPFCAAPGREALAGLDFQRHIEREASRMGGGDLTVPVQTAPDFIEGRERPRSRCRRLRTGSASSPPGSTCCTRPRSPRRCANPSSRSTGRCPVSPAPTRFSNAPRRGRQPRSRRPRLEGLPERHGGGFLPGWRGRGVRAGGIVSAAVDGLCAAGRVGAFVEGADW